MIAVGVAISGSGTNLQALLDDAARPGCPYRIAVVVSNKPDAYGLERARAARVPAVALPHRGLAREDYDQQLVDVFRAHGCDWVALAGFLRIVTGRLLDAFPERVLNIHPALLPAFPGMHGQAQAFAAGVRIAGATVHLVDRGTDTGPIVIQGAVPVLPDDDADRLAARILTVEHQIYPRALRWAAEGRLVVDGRRVRVTGDPPTWVWGG